MKPELPARQYVDKTFDLCELVDPKIWQQMYGVDLTAKNANNNIN